MEQGATTDAVVMAARDIWIVMCTSSQHLAQFDNLRSHIIRHSKQCTTILHEQSWYIVCAQCTIIDVSKGL